LIHNFRKKKKKRRKKKKEKKRNYFDKFLMNQNNLWDIHQNNFYYKVPIYSFFLKKNLFFIFVIEGTIKKKVEKKEINIWRNTR